LALGAPRTRAVLGILLSRPGRLVSTDQFVDELWPDRPPPDARALVHGYISRLRRALRRSAAGSGAADRVVTRKPGYLLRVDDEELDVRRFERLVAEARAAREAGQLERGVELFRQAHQQWRGEPLADVPPTPTVAATVTSLAELRLTTLEEQFETALAAGHGNDLITELTALVTAHPFREPLVGQLMRALYRSGRTADALATYQHAKQRLAAELGIEPGPELQQLELAVLRAKPHLGGTSGAPRQRTDPRPAQLPTDLSTFAGRKAELAELLALRPGADPDGGSAAVVVTSIDGMAGIGKTTLAVHAAHRLAGRFPDGQLFVNLHGYTQDVAPVEPSDALDRMLRALGLTGDEIPHGLEERAALFRGRLADRQVLILLDNAASEAQVAPLLPGAPRCLVLITSRRSLTALDDARPLSLSVLPSADATALFTQAVGPQRLVDGSPGLVEELVELCGRLPLAIRIAAARLRARPAWTLAHLVDRLRDHRRRLDELEAGPRSVAAAVRLSLQHLPADQQRMFRLLGRHPGADFDAHAAAALAGTAARPAVRRLEDLVDDHLLQSHRPGRYRFHDLLRLFAAEQADRQDPAEEATPLHRLLSHYLSTARRASDAIWPNRRLDGDTAFVEPDGLDRLTFDGRADALTWLDTERANLIAVAGHVADAPPATARFVVHLARTVMWYLTEGGHWSEWESLCDHAISVAVRTDDLSGQAMALAGLARLSHHRHDLDKAVEYLHRALVLRQEIGDRRGEGVCLCNLGIAYTELGDLGAAERYLKESLDRRHEVGDTVGEAHTRLSLAGVCLRQGSHDDAYEHLRRALSISRACGDPSGESGALIAIGNVHAAAGRLEEARKSIDAGLSVCRAAGNRDKERDGLLARAAVLQRLDLHAEARADLERAATLREPPATA
jgi:DNA-binding SARP family transcriptional activator